MVKVLDKFIENLRKKVDIDLLGLVGADSLDTIRDRILENQSLGFYTDFEVSDIEKRTNPNLHLQNCKSIFVAGISYFWDCKPDGKFKISNYASGKDYHKVLGERLLLLKEELKKNYSFSSTIHVDTGGFYEKEIGRKAGFGFYGKNSLLINEKLGSYFFLGLLFTDISFNSFSTEVAGSCGDCNLCVKACPAGAIIGDYRVDFSKCHSYLTQKKIEDLEIKNLKYAYGCDICQLVCPKNKGILKNLHEEFCPTRLFFDDIDFSNYSNKAFKREFSDYAFSWVGKKIIERNIDLLSKKD